MSDDIRLVHGPEIEDVLAEEGGVAVFRYNLNIPVFVLTLLVGGSLLAMAGMMWWNGQLQSVGWFALFGVFNAAGLAIGSLAAYWFYFAETQFLALSKQKVFVGRRNRMWSIDWELLDREALGFDEMSHSSIGGRLDLEVAGQEIPVHIYNTFVRLDDIQGLMFRVLQHLKGESPIDDAELDKLAEGEPLGETDEDE